MAPRAALRVAEGSSPAATRPRGFASPLAGFVGRQDSHSPQGKLSRPAGRISVLDDPSKDTRWLDPEGEARQLVISKQCVTGNRAQGIDESLVSLGRAASAELNR